MKKTNRRDIFKGRALAHMKSEPIALLAALFAGVAGAAMPLTQFRLPLLKNAPVVDGRVDPSEWRNAVGFFGLCAYSTDQAVSVPVEVRVGRTADRLFVAATRTVGPAGLPIVPKNGDADVTSDDNFECLFVNDILLEEPDLRQIIANSVGEISAAYSCDKVRTTWTPSGVETKSTLKDGLWQFEMSVPLKEVGFAEKDAERHGLRVCHTFRNLGTKEGCQASAQPEDVEYFGTDRIMKVAFDDEVPAVTLREGKSDRSNWRTTLELFNGTKREMRLAVRVEGRPADSQPGGIDTEVILKPGEVRTLPVSGVIIGDEKVDFFASVRKAGDGNPCFFRQLRWRPNAPAPDWVASDADISGPVVDFAYYPSYDRIRVKADVSRMEKRPDEVMLRLESEAGKTLARMKIRTDAAGKAERIWKIPSLKAETEKSGKGGYVLVVTCGTEEIRRPFRRDVFPWEGFRGGRSGTLPPPFTPVRKEGDHVKTILKDHTVGQFGLWNQVNAAGKDILARPMRLVSEPTSYAAELEASSSWDVDGMMIWELKLKPGRCRSLWLEIPLKAERANLMHACTDGLRFNFSGALPSGNGRIWDSSMARRNAIVGNFVPYVWIGGPLRGLSVFGENDKGWVTDDEKARCQEIHREGDGTVRLVLNLIQKPCEVVESRRIRIGFLATPTKPMEDGWRYKNCGELMGSCWWWGGYTDSDELYPYDGTDEFFRKMGETRRAGKYDYDRNYADKAVAERLATVPKNAPEYKTTQEIIKTHYHGALERMAAYGCTPGAKIAFYTNARGLRLGRPEGTTFCDEWTREEFSNRPFAVGDSLSYSLDPNDTYLDFAAYWWERMISTGACDYLYWDDVFCAANFDLVGTDAYVRDDGRIQPATGIFNQRAIVRRGAVLQAERNWESRRNWVHMTNTALAPVCSFAGQIYDWEDFYGDKPLHERYPRELIQAETIGRQFGCRSAVMAYFATKDPESAKLQKLERQGTGLCLTHELEWERWRVKCYAKAMELLEAFGYRKPEARVWNYWDEDVPFPAAVTGGQNAALAVARDGEAVFVVSDFEKGGDYELKPDIGALGVPEVRRAIDLESGRELPMKDGGVRFTLGKYDFIMIRFAKKAQGDS